MFCSLWLLYTLVSNSTLGSLVGGGITPWIPGGMWNPGMDPKWDRWDPALDCRWEAAFTLDPGWKAGSQVGPWAGLAGSRLGSQVRGGIPPRIPGGRRDPTLDPGWEVGSQVGPQVGKAGSRQWWRDPGNPTWDPRWDWRYPTWILPAFLPAK